jgi:hypothetical protein
MRLGMCIMAPESIWTAYVIKKLRGLSPQANYSDRRLAAKLMTTSADIGCNVVIVADPYGRILDSLDRSPNFSFQVAP